MKSLSNSLLGIAALLLAACDGSSPPDPAQAVTVCKSCHSFEKAGPARSGPNLFGVVGRVAGSDSKFKYSPSLKASGINWTPEKLDAFLAAPQQLVPGNRMSMSGISDAAKRKAIVDYLATLK